jgi:hypothetical protein
MPRKKNKHRPGSAAAKRTRHIERVLGVEITEELRFLGSGSLKKVLEEDPVSLQLYGLLKISEKRMADNVMARSEAAESLSQIGNEAIEFLNHLAQEADEYMLHTQARSIPILKELDAAEKERRHALKEWKEIIRKITVRKKRLAVREYQKTMRRATNMSGLSARMIEKQEEEREQRSAYSLSAGEVAHMIKATRERLGAQEDAITEEENEDDPADSSESGPSDNGTAE